MSPTYLKLEILRTLRTRRYLFFTVVMPLILFLVLSGIGDTSWSADGVTAVTYAMVSMATFGAMGAAISSGGRIALERENGWMRQLRLTGLSSTAYFTAKMVNAFVSAIPAVVLVFLAGAIVKGVHLPLSHWVVAAASILLALLPLVALGVLLGTAVRPDTLQGLFSGLFFLLALFGGIWFPLEVFPQWLADLCKVLPSYWVNDAGRAAVAGTWIGWTGVAVAVGWTLVLARCSGFVYARSSERA